MYNPTPVSHRTEGDEKMLCNALTLAQMPYKQDYYKMSLKMRNDFSFRLICEYILNYQDDTSCACTPHLFLSVSRKLNMHVDLKKYGFKEEYNVFDYAKFLTISTDVLIEIRDF